MVDIEKTGSLARRVMFLGGSGCILNGHFPPGKRDDSASMIEVPFIQVRPFQSFGHFYLLIV